jgi:WD40 repeat protein
MKIPRVKLIHQQDSTASEVVTWTGHKAAVTSLAFSADGTVLVSGSEDGTIRFGMQVIKILTNDDNHLPSRVLVPGG